MHSPHPSRGERGDDPQDGGGAAVVGTPRAHGGDAGGDHGGGGSAERTADALSVCATCKRLANAYEPPWRWRCLQFPRPAEYSPITDDTVADPPHYSCKEINGHGQCKFYLNNPAGNALDKRRKPDVS